MEFQDKNLTCSDCGNTFVFTAGEQQFYQEKGFAHEPRRCRDCRGRRRPEGGGGGGGSSEGRRGRSGGGRSGGGRSGGGEGSGGEKQHYNATCSACGGPAKLTFEPSPDRPVFCRTCFNARQNDRNYSR